VDEARGQSDRALNLGRLAAREEAPPIATELVGRAREIGDLQAIVASGGAAVLLGEAGIGKTVLLAAAAVGRKACAGGAFGMLQFVPYLPLIRAVGPLIDRDPARVAVEVIARVGAEGVLVLDDLHWADNATLGILQRVVGQVPFVSAVRTGDAGTERALQALRDLGVTEVQIEPLGDADAAELARRWQPDIGPLATRQLVGRAGGNPLLIEELARAGVTTTLKFAIEHRLRSLTGEERSILELLSIALAPLDLPDAGTATDHLIRDGLVVRSGPGLTIRHTLIAEVIAEGLSERRMKRLHREAAAVATDPAIRARHLLAAGDRRAAFVVASGAAVDSVPGMRAALLGLAAECVTGAQTARFRVEAAEALTGADLFADAARALGPEGDADKGDPELAARARSVHAQIRWGVGDADGALASAEAAVALATPGTELAARLLVERAWVVTHRREGVRAVELARDALVAVRAAGLRDGPAQRVLGIATSIVGGEFDEYLGMYEAAAADARAAGDIGEELSCGKLIVATLESGDQELGLELGAAFVERAMNAGMVGWAQSIRSSMVSLASSHGEYERAVVEGQALVAEPVERRIRSQANGFIALALVHLGRFDEARRQIKQALSVAPDDIDGRFDLIWADAELALAGGDPGRALSLADDVLRRFGDADYSDTAFLRVIRDWACYDLGRAPGPQVEHPRPLHRQHLGTSVERRGIRLLATKGSELEAAQHFLAAAEAFQRYHRASEIRCRWAHGEALRRAGQLEAARATLEATEAVAAELGMLAISPRIRRSLRLTGARRSAQRASSGVLSAREREVLAGVAAGLTNGQIAARLGISRPTVARIVSNATAKLGASSRVEAAVAALNA